MRTHHRLLIVLLLLLGSAGAGVAQTNPPGQQQPPAPSPAATPAEPLSARVGLIDFGFRGSVESGDPGILQEFRDLRTGAVLSTLRYARSTETWEFNAALDNVGYRDQRYLADWNRYGRVRASFEWTQIPWFHTTLSRTPFTEESGGTLRLPDTLQTGSLPVAAAAAPQFDLRARRDVANARVSYMINPATDVKVSFTSTNRTGEQVWGAGFGFTAANEVPLPLDQRTNDINAALQWAERGRILQVGYAGSFYNNDVPVLVWDSPLTLTDLSGNPSQGRMAIFPSSTAHTVSAMGALPLPGRSRAHAYASFGTWNQDEPVLPHTINTAIPQPPLSRTTAEAEARILALNLGFNSRAISNVMLSARFRTYDFDNRTPPFIQPQYVRADQTVAESLIGQSEPFEYTRHFLDVNGVFTGLAFASVRFGYSMEHDDRAYRFLHQTTDHVLRASIDTVGTSWLMLRAQYEHANRTGEGFDEQALSAVNEQVSLRQFDISDRVRDRISTVFQVAPNDRFGVTATVGIGRDDRPDDFFGLLDNDHLFYTIALDVTPTEAVNLGLSYGRESYDTRQRSRQANPGPQFNDPTRDWEADGDEEADTITANLDLPTLAPRTGIRLAYDYSRGRSRYLYLLPQATTLATPEQLPPVRHELHRAQADLRYDLTQRLAIGVSYWFDRFDLSDFAQERSVVEPLGIPGSGLFLGYAWVESTLHTTWVRLIVNW
jgi:MtrB/PioB family decaheme-associated outer membrane protein